MKLALSFFIDVMRIGAGEERESRISVWVTLRKSYEEKYMERKYLNNEG